MRHRVRNGECRVDKLGIEHIDSVNRSASTRDRQYYDMYSSVLDVPYSPLPGMVLAARYAHWRGNDPTDPPASFAEIVSRTGLDESVVCDVMTRVAAAAGEWVRQERRRQAMRAGAQCDRAAAAMREQDRAGAGEADIVHCVVRPSIGSSIFLVDAEAMLERDKIIFVGPPRAAKLVYDRLVEAFPELEWNAGPDSALEV